MDIVPVIDLQHGQVVRALRGDRQAYRPIRSALCGSSDPRIVAPLLCAYAGAGTLYIADLDALQGRAPQTAVIRHLLAELPSVVLWVDAGFRDGESADAWRASLGAAGSRAVPVFGSESLASHEALEHCFAGPSPGILSLDRRNGRPLDPSGGWECPSLWPSRVIVMTLDRVGSDDGPDLHTLAAVRQRARGAALIGAGGIRNIADLQAARRSGAAAWLVANALHERRLPRGVSTALRDEGLMPGT
jgi:HisA/HisF family protein